MTYEVTIDGKLHQVELTRGREGLAVKVDGKPVAVDAVLAERDVLSLLVDGRSYDIKREHRASASAHMHIIVRGISFTADVRDPRSFRSRQAAGAGASAGPKKLVSPMPGKVVR